MTRTVPLSLALAVALPVALAAQEQTIRVGGDVELDGLMEALVVADGLAYAIPDAERVTVSGGGHAVHMQEPERFTAELVRFFGSR